MIEKALEKELKGSSSKTTLSLASWMGQPYEKKYPERSTRYLESEARIMEKIIQDLEDDKNENIVVETTGSLIYLDEKILKKLKDLTKVVYLETPESVIIEIFNLYMLDLKPVIWEESFSKKTDETNKQALQRSFYELMKFRLKKYEKLAKSSVDYHLLHSKLFTVDDFLAIISD